MPRADIFCGKGLDGVRHSSYVWIVFSGWAFLNVGWASVQCFILWHCALQAQSIWLVGVSPGISVNRTQPRSHAFPPRRCTRPKRGFHPESSRQLFLRSCAPNQALAFSASRLPRAQNCGPVVECHLELKIMWESELTRTETGTSPKLVPEMTDLPSFLPKPDACRSPVNNPLAEEGVSLSTQQATGKLYPSGLPRSGDDKMTLQGKMWQCFHRLGFARCQF